MCEAIEAKEGTTVATKPFRVRRSRQGDIANSTLWYVGRPNNGMTVDGYRTFANAQRYRIPMIYVGGNDGMLHGFLSRRWYREDCVCSAGGHKKSVPIDQSKTIAIAILLMVRLSQEM